MGLAADMSQLVVCVTGIYVSYLGYGILQEGIYKFKDSNGRPFEYTLTLLTIQCAVNMIGAKVGQACFGSAPAKSLPPSSLIKPAASFIGAMFCSNQALRFVSYPVQALAKSCKMVPVIGFQRLWFKKLYTMRDYFMVFLVTLGVIVFRYKSKGGENSMYGLALLFCSLCLDGVTGPYQENVRNLYAANGHQIMYYCNMWACAGLILIGLFSGEYFDSLPFLGDMKNIELIQKVAIFALFSACGQNFIFLTLEKFDALILTTITTTRKCATVALSVLWYGHELTQLQYFGIALVTAGLALELWGKYTKKKAQQKKSS